MQGGTQPLDDDVKMERKVEQSNDIDQNMSQASQKRQATTKNEEPNNSDDDMIPVQQAAPNPQISGHDEQ